MLPLFDMMLRAQDGAAIQAMAKQFNLAQEQAVQVLAALIPAFSFGLKNRSANPYDFAALTRDMLSGSYAKYFEDMSMAFTPEGIADGNAALEKLFGSKEVSRAIAAQAEQLSGIGQDILKKMMPAMADTIMGGLFKQMSGQMPGSDNAFAASPMGQMMKPWLEGMGLQPKAKPQAADPLDNPFIQAAHKFWGIEQKQRAEAASGNPFADNPFAKAFQELWAGTSPQSSASVKPKEKPAAEDFYRDTLNSMFDSGLEVQKSYQKNMEAIFDGYLRSASASPDKPPET
ncbi:DUF937 domain-containing protein [Rhizobium sp. LCM 4573]|uniref:DUF937 domain-containing protein n=1 Tax=Rhizobium sp. LCM 4573 TaxID=1848291 RepID=UPI0008D93CDC|nr:DUF937 domain-containing protein [Rhizobium sp. LCM 4573]OHV75816.1 hypothetical protein LCM4573_14175 [Rhizobium sp. LCM 4573]